jgi:Uma2 family endonuclease
MTTSAPIDTRQEFVREIAEILPEQGEWSAEEYLWLTNRTNRLIEFSDGYIEVLPMPTQKHQAISQYLFLAFLAFVQRLGGVIFYAPLRIRLKSGKFREPDLMLVLNANDPRCHNEYWDGADLVVEIVSPDDPNRDLVKKRKEYAQAGIPEYWIVNPQTETIMVLRLEGAKYVEHGEFGRELAATSALLAGFEVSVDAVFDAS